MNGTDLGSGGPLRTAPRSCPSRKVGQNRKLVHSRQTKIGPGACRDIANGVKHLHLDSGKTWTASGASPPMMVVPGLAARQQDSCREHRPKTLFSSVTVFGRGISPAALIDPLSARPIVSFTSVPVVFCCTAAPRPNGPVTTSPKSVGEVEVTEFAGRDCWTVQLAPPDGKPYPLRIWVDVESGQILGYRGEEAGEGSQFVDLIVGEIMNEGLFVWDGPAVTPVGDLTETRGPHRGLHLLPERDAARG